MKLKVQTLDAKAAGDIELNDELFGLEPRADILFRVVNWPLANRRAPARAARERSDVARTGKKCGRQKGDDRMSTRSELQSLLRSSYDVLCWEQHTDISLRA